MRARSEHALGHRVARGFEELAHAGRPARDIERELIECAARSLEFGFVHAHVGELVRAAHVIAMGVREHDRERALEQIARRGEQARDAQPRIHEQIALAPAHVPDVAAQQRRHVRLEDPRYALLGVRPHEPLAARNRQQRCHLPILSAASLASAGFLLPIFPCHLAAHVSRPRALRPKHSFIRGAGSKLWR